MNANWYLFVLFLLTGMFSTFDPEVVSAEILWPYYILLMVSTFRLWRLVRFDRKMNVFLSQSENTKQEWLKEIVRAKSLYFFSFSFWSINIFSFVFYLICLGIPIKYLDSNGKVLTTNEYMAAFCLGITALLSYKLLVNSFLRKRAIFSTQLQGKWTTVSVTHPKELLVNRDVTALQYSDLKLFVPSLFVAKAGVKKKIPPCTTLLFNVEEKENMEMEIT